jgi:hypothetical protein
MVSVLWQFIEKTITFHWGIFVLRTFLDLLPCTRMLTNHLRKFAWKSGFNFADPS